MTFSEHGSRPWIVPASIALAFIVFFIDTLTPLGNADYIFYFIPVALCVFQDKPQVPYLMALATTVLSVIGFYLSPAGAEHGQAWQNRWYAVFTVWAVTYLVRLTVSNRNMINNESWIREGQNILAEKIRGELTAQEISQRALAFFAEYLKMNVATVYLKHHSKPKLDFLIGHAVESPRKSFELGEGTLGQCVLDKKIVSMSNLPDGYLKVSSALGDENLNTLIIVPLYADNTIVGAMELGFIAKPEKQASDLIQLCQESLAIGIRSAIHKTTLNELLYQSQQMTEELQSQQEELKVANEELEQQSKALKASHSRMENQQAELEQSNQQLEEQAQALEHQKAMLNEKNHELLEAQSHLQQRAAELERASKYKSEFLANMSHELRTPLNSTLILAKMLAENKQGNLTEEQVQFAEVIHSSGNDLLNLINDILDLSKVEAGKMLLNPENINLESFARSIKSMFKEQAASKNIAFNVSIAPGTPDHIFTDPQRLDQIIKNFVSNALKFTEKGSISINLSKDNDKLCIAVEDTGIGIEHDKLDLIFEAFTQADGTTNRKYGGTGLGLSIARELARMLKGEIKVTSEVGKGSIFSIYLPMTIQNNEVKEQNGEKPVKTTIKHDEQIPKDIAENKFSFSDDRLEINSYTRRIVIIEDDESFAKILYNLAHEMGFGVVAANNAGEGMKLIQQVNPHGIILDIRLPDYNGLLVLDQLKMSSKTRHIPVHVISSSDFSKPALEMGAAAYHLKPVKQDELKKAFQELSNHLSQKNKKVLVVEDDKVQRDYIKKLIGETNVIVDAVETATEALSQLNNNSYDCMIMDLSLPDVTGQELLDKLANANHPFSAPPVIIYTARDITEEEENLLRKYSESIIIKGARSPERLLNEVSLFIHKVESELPAEKQRTLRNLRSRDKTLDGKNILIVDDDVRNIFALTSALESYGAKVVIARNGKEALDTLESNQTVDMVLMDIMMPVMDGYEAMKRIRENKKFKQLPIIALTAKAMKDDHQKSLEAGANDYLAKPMEIEKLISLMRVWLPVSRGFVR